MFALQARMITCLGLIPIENLVESLDELGNYIPRELQPILDWFEDTYIGRRNRRGNGRRQPLFPIRMWNVHQRSLKAEDRINNQAVPAHRRLQTELGMRKPIDRLRKVQHGRDLFYEQLIAGQNPPLQKYRDAHERILSILQNYFFAELPTTLKWTTENKASSGKRIVFDKELVSEIAHNFEMGRQIS
ncbi:hypothetical protein QE152_g35202 [Popillia japonica]|uniref:Uncharacterized protein n=1 Tax=Popillia japonica TaxID=7064 RepID=A0AAW1IGC5_POPJA